MRDQVRRGRYGRLGRNMLAHWPASARGNGRGEDRDAFSGQNEGKAYESENTKGRRKKGREEENKPKRPKEVV